MKRPRIHAARSRRLVAVGFVVLACLVGIAVAAPIVAAEQNVDLGSEPLGDMEDPSTIIDTANPDAADPAAGTLTDADVDGLTKPKLRALYQQLHGKWLRTQAELQRLDAVRDAAESEVDDALEAYARRIAANLDAADDVALTALRSARETTDTDTRAQMLTTLGEADQAVVLRHVKALAAVERTSLAADEQRVAMETVGADMQFVRSVIRGREPKRELGESFQASHVFATGPIPDIGYWGSASGGGMLSGWSGLAGAVLDGVGCEPPAGLEASGVRELGEASWYGPGFHGNSTANGEAYDQNAMTAAHKSLPFGTVVRVYSNSTARCAFVRINDRGPYIDGRIIDLSHAAAQAIGMDGTAPVQIEIWATPGMAVAPITEPDKSTWPNVGSNSAPAGVAASAP